MHNACVSGETAQSIEKRIRELPVGKYSIQSVGACPSILHPVFHYLCTTDGNIWKVHNQNAAYIENMVALSHVAGIKPFPCLGVYTETGRIVVDNISHVDEFQEQKMKKDPTFDAQVVSEWLRGTSADSKMHERKVARGRRRR